MTRAIPNALTTIGLWFGLLGVWLFPHPVAIVCLVCSLAFDVFDGICARDLNAVTATGAEFDWTVDVGLAYVLAFRAGLFPLAHVALVGIQVWARRTGRRVSGRAAVTVAAIACSLSRWTPPAIYMNAEIAVAVVLAFLVVILPTAWDVWNERQARKRRHADP